MADIKLFVSCHRPFPVPKHPLFVPIQVGAALTEERFAGCLQDNVGDHISEKNRSYCELTAQYWAWKNIQADYYGFFHYRRYLYPDITAKRPYHIERKPSLQALEKLGYKRFDVLIQKYDLIVPMGEDMYVSVRGHYGNAPYHHDEDLALVIEILKARCPEMSEYIRHYLSQSTSYFGNIFIMKRFAFLDYCSWLFSILEEFDRKKSTACRNPQEQRADGYLAERLLGIYYTYYRGKGRLQTLELPRVHFVPEYQEYQKQRMLSIILPPGSRRRSFVKYVGRRLS